MLTHQKAPTPNKAPTSTIATVTAFYAAQFGFSVSHVFGLFPQNGELIYMFGIFLLLFTSCMSFVLLLFSDEGESQNDV